MVTRPPPSPPLPPRPPPPPPTAYPGGLQQYLGLSPELTILNTLMGCTNLTTQMQGLLNTGHHFTFLAPTDLAFYNFIMALDIHDNWRDVLCGAGQVAQTTQLLLAHFLSGVTYSSTITLNNATASLYPYAFYTSFQVQLLNLGGVMTVNQQMPITTQTFVPGEYDNAINGTAAVAHMITAQYLSSNPELSILNTLMGCTNSTTYLQGQLDGGAHYTLMAPTNPAFYNLMIALDIHDNWRDVMCNTTNGQVAQTTQLLLAHFLSGVTYSSTITLNNATANLYPYAFYPGLQIQMQDLGGVYVVKQLKPVTAQTFVAYEYNAGINGTAAVAHMISAVLAVPVP
ncbi:hypothetical protein HXX76_008919 [Chlamydomonas incerta]|uniref:FAS1 domain-containing protein n=1 Tax=Chlamydomonas incerta TaxID=51695 RepID=A0A835T6J2_CHLIN|nr:hypothetical protein HXX76_008919 [Chlamydomonas incerta]|eukprot:KAG2432575.1 hypothetical protein HXX76_008919 [Chlamydomonas incerta]